MGAVAGPAGCCAGCCGAGISFSPLVITPDTKNSCWNECCSACNQCCADDIYSCNGCCSDCYGDMCVRKGWFAQICQQCKSGHCCDNCCCSNGNTCIRGCDTCCNCCGQPNTQQNIYNFSSAGSLPYSQNTIPNVSPSINQINTMPIIYNSPPIVQRSPVIINPANRLNNVPITQYYTGSSSILLPVTSNNLSIANTGYTSNTGSTPFINRR